MTGGGVTVEEVDRLLHVITLDRIEQSSQHTTSGKLSSLAIAERSPADCSDTRRNGCKQGIATWSKRRSRAALGRHPGSQRSQRPGVGST